MDRVYQSSAVESPPEPVASSGSFPTSGNKLTGQKATVPGPYWFYSITEEIRNAIVAAGLTPDSSQVDQLSRAMAKFLPLTGGNVTGALSVQNKTVARSVNGIDADSNGNVSLGSLVKSVNGFVADASGNVALKIPVSPDYTAGISVAFNTLRSGYTAPKKGLLVTKNICTGVNSRLVMLVNNVQVFYSGYQSSGGQTYVSELILGEGDVVRTSTSEQSSFECVFYPYKG